MSRALLCFLVLFTGCMVGPDYRRPCVEVPEVYRFDEKGSESAMDTLFWEQFDDPVLTNYVREALTNNRDIKIAAARIEGALGILMQTQSSLFPQLGYQAAGARTLASNATGIPLSPTTPNPLPSFQALTNVSWELDLWGRLSRLTQSSEADYYAAEEAWQDVVLSLVSLVTNTYLQLLGLDEQLAISKRTLVSYGEMVDYFDKQFRYGQVSRINVVQATTQYEKAAAAIPEIELSIVRAENVLSLLLARNPGPIERGKTIYAIESPIVPAGLPSDLLCARPDIRQAEMQLISANALVGAAEALYFPSISLTGDYGYSSKELKQLFTGPAKTWIYGTNITGPLYTFGNIEGQVTQAKAEKRAAILNYQQTVQNAFKDVDDSLASHEYYMQRLEAQGKLVKASREYEYLAMLQYQEGYSPYFVVLQAQEQLFPAELAWVQTRVQVFTSVVNVYKAMGGGFRP
ncbi:efflux transporter outer membrane subunit [Estrella lausannensis]|uniref:RND efflux system outer membrane lipoprotein n=1 Tax=Estrella lausannensis TaxID=483423 RepID=A0A0H5DQ59_9BACT|nr:efflux transporter outer membrane subunit [Estrella lausannensis]CRX37664.1 RND efflux system outer membrane lipoprotein [Estrella lausannensis]